MQKLLSNPLDYNSSARISNFNCMGFALQTFEWGELDSYSEAEEECDGEIDTDFIVDLCADEIVKLSNETDGPLIRVYSYEEVPIGIEVVGFRVAVDEEEIEDTVTLENGDIDWVGTGKYRKTLDDFHFIWRDEKGCWWHKPGGCLVTNFFGNPNEEWGRYNSEIAWFARNPSDEVEGKWECFGSIWEDRDEDEDEED